MKRIIFTLWLTIFSLSVVIARQGQGGYITSCDSLVLFHDSEDPRFYDPSVVTQTFPGTVVTEVFDPHGTNADKLPVVTTPVKGGANALKLQWNCASGGSWMALIASIGWKPVDLTAMSHLRFWINSPTALDTVFMPLIHLEAMAGTPGGIGSVRLANYVKTGLKANTWTRVNIALSDFGAKYLLLQARDTINGILFSRNGVDNTQHTLYLDEFTFDNSTGIDNPSSTNKMNAYYMNGELHFAHYTGHVRIYDMIGRMVTEGDALNGTLSVDLKKDTYIVSTTEGSFRIELP